MYNSFKVDVFICWLTLVENPNQPNYPHKFGSFSPLLIIRIHTSLVTSQVSSQVFIRNVIVFLFIKPFLNRNLFNLDVESKLGLNFTYVFCWPLNHMFAKRTALKPFNKNTIKHCLNRLRDFYRNIIAAP